jgi:hypothetical protein
VRTFDGFFDTLSNLEWLAVVVATLVVLFVLTTIFYGPTPIGKKWYAETGQTMPGWKFNPKTDIPGIVIILLSQIGVAFLGAYDDIEHSLVTALVVTLFIVGPLRWGRVVWEKGNKTTALIDIAFAFFLVAVGGYVQGLVA